MLTRMMAFFGMEESAAKERMATRGDRASRAHIVRDNDGAMVLALREEFSRRGAGPDSPWTGSDLQWKTVTDLAACISSATLTL